MPDYVFGLLKQYQGPTRYNIVRLSDGKILAYGYSKSGCEKMQPAFGVPSQIMTNGVMSNGSDVDGLKWKAESHVCDGDSL